MRLFIAVNFSPATQAKLVGLQGDLRARCAGGSFSQLENLHLTLAFLGEVEPGQVRVVQTALERVDFQPFALTVDKVGCGRRHGRALWWAGLAPSKPLMAMQRGVVAELGASQISFDARAYQPHITLAREVTGEVAPWPVEPFTEQVTTFDLMLSQRAEGRLTYSSLFTRTAS